jgi:hypothetical protein
MSREIALLFYPGHLGPIGPDGPRSQLRNRTKGILWDRQVKAVPEPDAADLVRTGGFLYALTVTAAAKRYGLTQARVKELFRSPQVTASEYLSAPTEDAPKPKPVPVVVLTLDTQRRLRKEANSPKPAAAPTQE